MLRFFLCAVAALASSTVQLAQTSNDAPFAPQADCGDPRLESQAWIGIKGRVVGLQGSTLHVEMSEGEGKVAVHIAGIQVRRSMHRAFRDFIRSEIGGKEIDVMVNPSDWSFAFPKPRAVTGSVALADKDLGLVLIQRRIADFRTPKPYKMSHVLECRYRVASRSGIGVFRPKLAQDVR